MTPEYMTPFTTMIDLQTGMIANAPAVATRRLSDMRGLFADSEAESMLAAEDPLIYRVYEATENPEREGQLRYSTTVIYPGKVGDEFFMTKGHYHAKGDRAELYFGLQGEGLLLLQTPEGKADAQPMTPGAASYVPPYWGHRTVNTGTKPFAFLAVYPADAGYDYETIEARGFAALVLERGGKAELVANPRYRQP
jgi:glucose-6-phosphate isomerase, archaeal